MFCAGCSAPFYHYCWCCFNYVAETKGQVIFWSSAKFSTILNLIPAFQYNCSLNLYQKRKKEEKSKRRMLSALSFAIVTVLKQTKYIRFPCNSFIKTFAFSSFNKIRGGQAHFYISNATVNPKILIGVIGRTIYWDKTISIPQHQKQSINFFFKIVVSEISLGSYTHTTNWCKQKSLENSDQYY